jgi:hypothetical protein
MYKRCSKCKCVKPVSEFHRSKRDGYQPYCKVCVKAVSSPDRWKYKKLRYIDIPSKKDEPCQYERVLLALRRGPCVTSDFEVVNYKTAIYQLRYWYGYDIGSRKVEVQTKFGKVKDTQYFLRTGKEVA